MKISRSTWMLLIGFVLILLGAVLPALMVIQVLPSTFFLNFFAYTASVVGLFLGIIGIAERFVIARKKDPRDKNF
jgi:hypothetical protein